MAHLPPNPIIWIYATQTCLSRCHGSSIQLAATAAPSTCACGTKFSIEHALSCPKGGFPSIQHNEIRDLTADLLTEVCSHVCIEPDLQL